MKKTPSVKKTPAQAEEHIAPLQGAQKRSMKDQADIEPSEKKKKKNDDSKNDDSSSDGK